jgi:hypothetical protein
MSKWKIQNKLIFDIEMSKQPRYYENEFEDV